MESHLFWFNGEKGGPNFRRSGLTKGGRNSKIHAIVDEFLHPWVLILTPGNTADCVMAQECVSLIPGIKQLLADKGYDTDAFRAFLRKEKIKPVIPGKSSSAVSDGSRISGASPRAMTSSLETSSPRSASLLSSPIGFELIDSGP
jgi:transposase